LIQRRDYASCIYRHEHIGELVIKIACHHAVLNLALEFEACRIYIVAVKVMGVSTEKGIYIYRVRDRESERE
jgi:hypothetical protein